MHAHRHYINKYMDTYICIPASPRPKVHHTLCIHTHAYTYINTHTHIHTYIHTYMHTYIHAYIHTYQLLGNKRFSILRAYIHTHTHT